MGMKIADHELDLENLNFYGNRFFFKLHFHCPKKKDNIEWKILSLEYFYIGIIVGVLYSLPN